MTNSKRGLRQIPMPARIRLAAGRIHRITGNYDRRYAHLNAIQNFAGVATAAQLEKARVLEDTGKRDEANVIYKKIIDNYQNGMYRSAIRSVLRGALRCGQPNTSTMPTTSSRW